MQEDEYKSVDTIRAPGAATVRAPGSDHEDSDIFQLSENTVRVCCY